MSLDGENPLQDRMVTPERSVFGTRLPRPTGVGRHLIIVVVVSIIALAIAIGFAERDVTPTGGAADTSATSSDASRPKGAPR